MSNQFVKTPSIVINGWASPTLQWSHPNRQYPPRSLANATHLPSRLTVGRPSCAELLVAEKKLQTSTGSGDTHPNPSARTHKHHRKTVRQRPEYLYQMLSDRRCRLVPRHRSSTPARPLIIGTIKAIQSCFNSKQGHAQAQDLQELCWMRHLGVRKAHGHRAGYWQTGSDPFPTSLAAHRGRHR